MSCDMGSYVAALPCKGGQARQGSKHDPPMPERNADEDQPQPSNSVRRALYFPLRLRPARRFRRLDDLHARTARRGAAVGNDVLELDAIVLLPHLAQPVSNITALNERVIGCLTVLVLVGDKGDEGDGSDLHLFVNPLIKLGDGNLDSVREFLEI